jgi:hypothetical protein
MDTPNPADSTLIQNFLRGSFEIKNKVLVVDENHEKFKKQLKLNGYNLEHVTEFTALVKLVPIPSKEKMLENLKKFTTAFEAKMTANGNNIKYAADIHAKHVTEAEKAVKDAKTVFETEIAKIPEKKWFDDWPKGATAYWNLKRAVYRACMNYHSRDSISRMGATMRANEQADKDRPAAIAAAAEEKARKEAEVLAAKTAKRAEEEVMRQAALDKLRDQYGIKPPNSAAAVQPGKK